MVDDVKLLLGIKDNSQDDLIALYINRAITVIINYINNEKYDKEIIEVVFPEAIIALVENAYKENTSSTKGIKSKTQGARSVTYADEKGFTITDDIKSLLPTPFIGMR